MDNRDDKYSSRLGFEPGTNGNWFTAEPNEPAADQYLKIAIYMTYIATEH